MNCRKCGALHITRRRAGVFACRRCGVQPGPTQMDRAGHPAPIHVQPDINPDRPPYITGTIWKPELPAKGVAQ